MNQVTGLTSALNSLSTSISTNTSDISNLKTSTTTLQTGLSTVQGRVGTLETGVSALQTSVASLTTTVNSLSTSSQSSPFTFVDGETPQGATDGTNAAFTLANAPSPAASLELYRNGLVQKPGVDYSLTGSAVTFTSVSVPKPGDILQAYYRMTGSSPVASFTDAEVPGGAVNGTNAAFTLAAAPSPAKSLKLYKNGMLLLPGGDYTLSGTTVTFSSSVIPQTGDTLSAYYRR
jgi:hypothetical protein